VRLDGDRSVISLDTSGGLLYKRGKRVHVTQAPIRGTLAALILREARWPEYDVLLDRMCGSGAFSLEGAEMATLTPANADRNFPFMDWPSFKPASFAHLKKKHVEKVNNNALKQKTIIASDVDPKAVEATINNIETAGLKEWLRADRSDFLDGKNDLLSKYDDALLVLNPPYGKRLNKKDTKKIYRQIGKKIRQCYKGGYAIIVPGLEYEKILSLGYDNKILFMNGGLKVSVIIKYC